MSESTVLVTGGRGFIGRHLVESLRRDGVQVRVQTREKELRFCEVQADLNDLSALARACSGVETVFHCAGYAHAFSASGADESRLHWEINCEGAKNVAYEAAKAGVRHLIFLSSVKASGDGGDECIDETYPLPPDSPYGQAKLAAERALLEIGATTGMQVTVLRPALVYGAGGRGNMERMGALVRRGLFPPLPDTGNRRSLVHVSDLVAAMRRVVGEPQAVGKVYIVAHAHAPSGRALYNAMRKALDYPLRDWAVPLMVLQGGAALGGWLGPILGRRLPLDGEVLDRLLGSACYSPARIEWELGWRAQVGLEAGLREMFGSK